MEHIWGESPSKKYARYAFWRDLALKMPVDKLMTGKFLLAGRGIKSHISAAIGMGVQPKNILVVEDDPEEAFRAQQTWPNVRVVTEDVRKLIKRYHREFSAAVVDLGGLIDPLVDTVLDVMAHGLKDGAAIGFAFRDGERSDFIDKAIEQEEAYARSVIAKLDSASPKKVLESFDILTTANFKVPMDEDVFEFLSRSRDSLLMGVDVTLPNGEKLSKYLITKMRLVLEAVKDDDHKQEFVMVQLLTVGTKRRVVLLPMKIYKYIENNPEDTSRLLLADIRRANPGEDISRFRRRQAGDLLKRVRGNRINDSLLWLQDPLERLITILLIDLGSTEPDLICSVPLIFNLSKEQVLEMLDRQREVFHGTSSKFNITDAEESNRLYELCKRTLRDFDPAEARAVWDRAGEDRRSEKIIELRHVSSTVRDCADRVARSQGDEEDQGEGQGAEQILYGSSSSYQ